MTFRISFLWYNISVSPSKYHPNVLLTEYLPVWPSEYHPMYLWQYLWPSEYHPMYLWQNISDLQNIILCTYDRISIWPSEYHPMYLWQNIYMTFRISFLCTHDIISVWPSEYHHYVLMTEYHPMWPIENSSVENSSSLDSTTFFDCYKCLHFKCHFFF